MYSISAEGYENTGAHMLIIKKLVKFEQVWKMYTLD